MATNEDLILKLEKLLTEIDADKKKAKEKELSEAWTKPAAVSLVVLAVLGATAAQRQGSFSTKSLKHLNSAIYHQVEASDQWSFYQAKSTKANLYEAGAEQVRAIAAGPEQAKALAEIDRRVQRYRGEQDPIKSKAEDFEHQRDDENKAADANAAASSKLALSSLTFQVSVALASISVVIKRKVLWLGALLIGLAGTVQLFYTLFFASPAQ